MIGRLTIFLIAVTMILPPAATAQPRAAAPDPAALDLARLLMGRDESLYDDADLGRFRTRIQNALLESEGACNTRDPECQGAAAAVAAQFAPALRDGQRGRSERLTANALSETLRPEEMAHIALYLRSDEGRRFLDAWAALRDPEQMQRRRRDLGEIGPEILNPARAQFRQRARNLPPPAPR